MNLISVDENKCSRCDLCIKACPLAILKHREEKAVPAAVDNADTLCIRCGHCVAVCPARALSHMDIDVMDCPPIEKEKVCHADQVAQLFRSRRSIRNYKSKEVPQKVLAQLIEMAHYAPTAHNIQEVEWLVISGAKQVKTYAQHAIDYFRSVLEKDPQTGKQHHYDMLVYAWDVGFDAICRNAPHLIMAHAEYKNTPLARYNIIDCSTALSYLEVAAPSLGLGTCWNGMLFAAMEQWPPLQKILPIAPQNRCYGVVMVGYPQFKYHSMPTRKEPGIIWK